MVTLAGFLQFPAGVGSQVREHMADVVRATRAEEGSVAYAFAADVGEPDRYWVFETWASDAALAQHCETEHFRTFSEQVLAKVIDGDVKRYSAE